MLNKLKNTFYWIFFISFISYTTIFYFSEKNIITTNKSRSYYSLEIINNQLDIPILKNDTNNIIEYSNEVEVFKKNKKYYKFWDLIK